MEDASEREQQVTPLELFFDLVFVFAAAGVSPVRTGQIRQTRQAPA